MNFFLDFILCGINFSIKNLWFDSFCIYLKLCFWFILFIVVGEMLVYNFIKYVCSIFEWKKLE